LLDVAGAPFLIHRLRLMALHDTSRVVLCVGYLREQIDQRIRPRQFGLEIVYSYDGPQPIGTLGAVRMTAPLLGCRFLILYGDTYLAPRLPSGRRRY
jgi:MurNAc alpha-1-phosphate uridylyltransferase